MAASSASLFTARKKFRFQIAPSDRQLWAIGMVAVQWSQLEMWMTVFVNGLTEDDLPARDQFTQTIAFKTRHRQFRALVEGKTLEPYRTSLLAIIDRIAETQQMRDRIIHGTWGSGEAAPNNPLESSATHVFSWQQKPRAPFEWKLTYGQIVETALRIDEIVSAMFEFLLNTAGRPQHFSTAETLQQIQRKPDRGQ